MNKYSARPLRVPCPVPLLLATLGTAVCVTSTVEASIGADWASPSYRLVFLELSGASKGMYQSGSTPEILLEMGMKSPSGNNFFKGCKSAR